MNKALDGYSMNRVRELETQVAGNATLIAQMIGTIADRDAELAKVKADEAAIRELMNVYNLGGWTDALEPMKRALKAEELLRVALARLALKGDDADDLRAAWEAAK